MRSEGNSGLWLETGCLQPRSGPEGRDHCCYLQTSAVFQSRLKQSGNTGRVLASGEQSGTHWDALGRRLMRATRCKFPLAWVSQHHGPTCWLVAPKGTFVPWETQAGRAGGRTHGGCMDIASCCSPGKLPQGTFAQERCLGAQRLHLWVVSHCRGGVWIYGGTDVWRNVSYKHGLAEISPETGGEERDECFLFSYVFQTRN